MRLWKACGQTGSSDGLKGFRENGVLRTISREKETFLFTDWSRKYSMPDWIIELWKQQYPAETVERMLQAS